MASGQGEPGVSCRCHPGASLVAVDADPVVRDRHRLRRAVVDDDHLDGDVALGEHGRDCLGEQLGRSLVGITTVTAVGGPMVRRGYRRRRSG